MCSSLLRNGFCKSISVQFCVPASAFFNSARMQGLSSWSKFEKFSNFRIIQGFSPLYALELLLLTFDYIQVARSGYASVV